MPTFFILRDVERVTKWAFYKRQNNLKGVTDLLGTIVLALALALDAFGVALGLGCGNRLRTRDKLYLVVFFGFFQLLFAFIGALVGNFIHAAFFNITNYLSGAVLLIMGALLLKEGYQRQEEDTVRSLGLWTYVVLGISVSLDALGIGFSVLYRQSVLQIAGSALVIGLIAGGLTALSFVVARHARNIQIIERYADYLGGVILIIFGLEMLI